MPKRLTLQPLWSIYETNESTWLEARYESQIVDIFCRSVSVSVSAVCSVYVENEHLGIFLHQVCKVARVKTAKIISVKFEILPFCMYCILMYDV